ncbi:MAG: CoA-binding protein [Gammaproteobacteria bacterium]|nr:CoA-binding protein [Gammaproteobacteria bacterium]
MPVSKTVAVLGASPKPARFSHKAVVALKDAGHHVLPVNPGQREIDGLTCYPDLSSCPDPVDTITVYVNPEILVRRLDDMIAANPRRVILNPGTESEEVIERLGETGIEVLRDCTLVMLSAGTF